MNSKSNKITRDNEDVIDECLDKIAKVQRREVDISTADVDIRLAEKLDALQINAQKRNRFSINKPRPSDKQNPVDKVVEGHLKRRNLSKEELKHRLANRYDTLIPELDPERKPVRLVTILSASESLELGREQAKKQIEQQLTTSSVSGNQAAARDGSRGVTFRDGYELPQEAFSGDTSLRHAVSNTPAKLSDRLIQFRQRKEDRLRRENLSQDRSDDELDRVSEASEDQDD